MVEAFAMDALMDELTKDQKARIIDFANNLVLKKPNLPILNNDPRFPPIVQGIEARLLDLKASRQLVLPNLQDTTDVVGVFSDYSGDSKGSLYYTYSFLICSPRHLEHFEREMGSIRLTYGLNDPFKEMKFEHLHYGPIARALHDYLIALNNYVPGLLFTLIVEKKILSLFAKDAKQMQKYLTQVLRDNGFGIWKPEVAEKMLRIVHTVAYFIALLSKNGQKIFWMTDNDNIAPNLTKTNDMLRVFCSVLPFYTPNTYEDILGATQFKETHALSLDLLGAADLVAGSIGHFFTRSRTMKNVTVKQGTRKVLTWLVNDGVCLKKLAVLFREDERGQLYSASLKFDPDEDAIDDDMLKGIFVPIYVE